MAIFFLNVKSANARNFDEETDTVKLNTNHGNVSIFVNRGHGQAVADAINCAVGYAPAEPLTIVEEAAE